MDPALHGCFLQGQDFVGIGGKLGVFDRDREGDPDLGSLVVTNEGPVRMENFPDTVAMGIDLGGVPKGCALQLPIIASAKRVVVVGEDGQIASDGHLLMRFLGRS